MIKEPTMVFDHTHVFTLTASALALVLSACATSGTDADPNTSRGIAAFEGDARLGEKVDRICFTQSIDSFYDSEHDTVVLRRGVRDDYIVEVSGYCRSLDNAQSVGLDTRSGSCLTRGDSLIVSESLFARNATDLDIDRCMVRAINKWDRDAIPL